MTRIMVWNIQFFTDGNFASNTRVNALPGQHIVDSILEVDPDILVVIEVRSSFTAVGTLIAETGGARGVRALRAKLGAGWYAVPPLLLNSKGQYQYVDPNRIYSEGIGVFFKGASVDFIGPRVWTGSVGVDRPANPPGALNPAAYDGVWANSLPTTAPAGCGLGGLTQNQFAGQATYQLTATEPRLFPAAWARNPFYTAFWDKQNNRVIKLLSVHLPPQYGGVGAHRAMLEIGQMPDLEQPIPSDSPNGDVSGVRVILGDFNVNAMRADQVGAYGVHNLANYRSGLPLNLATNVATMVAAAKYRGKAPFLHTPYNWWRASKRGYKALDNILVEYYPAGPAPANFAVHDWVPRVDPGSTHPQAYMAKALHLIRNNREGDVTFCNPVNFGKIADASDHIALSVEV